MIDDQSTVRPGWSKTFNKILQLPDRPFASGVFDVTITATAPCQVLQLCITIIGKLLCATVGFRDNNYNVTTLSQPWTYLGCGASQIS
ncbi:Protein of unknown function [Pyronema omphalodes CBS 100304]|uniref:Uncharacterized protein n=1 Tax=Pyronema omphalodes (strain CBS 100304) TaxID=1076935 RepID=U4LAM4_PYROM|nr:Protein of unknown function [Pyronema omphalodes CBS 100304]